MVTINGRYEGELRVSSQHGLSGASLNTDAPADNEGLGASFSPTDLVATALGSCMLTIMGIVARRRKIPIEGSSFQVTKHMVAQPERRIAKLEVVLELPASLAEEQRKVLEVAALSCPVHRSLHPDIEIPVSFRYEL